MIFVGSGEAFPFQMILRLQARLAAWAEKRGQEEERLNITQELKVSEREWSMDALELLLKLQSRPAKDTREANGAARVPRTNIDISYFEIMMVMRDFARRLTQGGFLVPAISRLEKLRSPDSRPQPTPSVSFVLNILGILYDQQGRIEESRSAHIEARSLQQAAPGGSNILQTKDPECIWSTNELGRVHRHLGNLSEAIGLHRSVLEVLKVTLVSDHPERLWTMATMARALREQGQQQEALELHLEAYNARCKSPGEFHPHTLWSAGDVAKCYRDMGKYDDALLWFRRALEGRSATLGPEHPDTLWSKTHMGLILEDLGRHREAISIHKEALQGRERLLGTEHAHTRWTQTVISRLQNYG
jgi:tetratricopeptide (TPR) repeat protein